MAIGEPGVQGMAIEVQLLGRFSVRRSGKEIPSTAFGGRLARVLTRVLVTRRGSFVPTAGGRGRGGLAGPGDRTYRGKNGHPVDVDVDVEDVSSRSFDAVVIPGGYAPDHFRRSERLLEIVREAHEDGKPVAAVCHAPWVAVSAGICKAKRMTSYFAIKDDVINAGADWVDREVVVDGNLITARKPADLGAFCRAIIAALEANDEGAER
jgi:protease I